MSNQFEKIYTQLTNQQKDDIVKWHKINMISMQDNIYATSALSYFFDLWKIHFPSVKQSLNCEGCRKAVVAFYHGLSKLITEKQKAVEAANTPNPKRARKEIREVIEVVKKKAKKSKSVKKHKTITGALSPTGTRK